MKESIKVIKPKLMNNFGFIPRISNLSIERRDKSFLSFDFQIDSKLKEARANSIFKSKIIDSLNIKIIISFNKELSSFLKENETFIFNGCSSLNRFKSSIDYREFTRKINSTAVNHVKSVNINGETQLSSVFKESSLYDNSEIEHLTVFIAVSVDNLKLSESLNKTFTNIIGDYSAEEFISNFNYKNSKINDISIFKQKEKFNFNSLSFKEVFLENILKLQNSILSRNKLSNNYFSELISNLNEDLNYSGIFVVNIENMFKNESKFPGFFSNIQFKDNFFKNENNIFPEFIKIIRYKVSDEIYESILEQKFQKEIDTKTCKISVVDIKSSTSNKISLSFLDKESFKLKEKYQYQIELIFQDKTIEHLNKLFQLASNEYKNIQEILNIANSTNFYSLSLNVFDMRLFDELNRHNLSIENCIKNVASILSFFKEFDDKMIQSLLALISGRRYNFEVLDSIFDIISYLRSEIIRIQNYATASSTSKITIKKSFSDIIDFSLKNESVVNIINSKNDKSHSLITIDDFKKNADNEILKYYNTTNIQTNTKYSYVTPTRISVKDKILKQNDIKIDSINNNDYNDILVDLYINKIYKGNYSSLSKYEKLKTILFHYNLFESKFSNNSTEAIKTNKILNKKYVEKEIVSDDYINKMFDVFIYCIVLKDFQLNEFNELDKVNNSTNLTKIQIENIPVAVKFVIESKQDNSLSRVKNEDIDRMKNSSESVFSTYMNTKKIYELEFLDTDDLKWKKLDDTKIDKIQNEEVIIRANSYTNTSLNIRNNDNLNIKESNSVFTIRGNTHEQNTKPFSNKDSDIKKNILESKPEQRIDKVNEPIRNNKPDTKPIVAVSSSRDTKPSRDDLIKSAEINKTTRK